jgi:acetyl/propionyl-CoA carboxylase alpha subunit
MPKRVHLSSDGRSWTADVSGTKVSLDGAEPMTVVPGSEDPGRLMVDGGFAGVTVVAGDVVWVGIGGDVFAFTIAHGRQKGRASSRDQDAFTPPMSATVVRITVKPGDAVRDGDVLIALEAMKMELPIRTPRDGVVRAIHCQIGELVQPGMTLVELED